MTQEELEALLRQVAPNSDPRRLEFGEGTETVEVEEPGEYAGAEPVKRKVNVRTLTWIDRGTGMALKVRVNNDGTYTKISQGVDPKQQGEPATTPAQQAAAAGSTAREPVPNRPGIYVRKTTRQDASGQAVTDTRYEDENGNPVPTPGANPNVTYREIKNPDGSSRWVQVIVDPTTAHETVNPSNIPGSAAPRPQATQIITDPSTGESVEIIRDPVTNQVVGRRALPRVSGQQQPGAAPSLPRIVVGRAQDALRQAYDDIQKEVDSGNRTAAWGENRRQEVLQAAQLAVRESQLAEQSRQYNQSQGYNVATARLGQMNSALDDALSVSMKINDLLEPGSSAGADLFRAVYMHKMNMLRTSGLDALAGAGSGGGVSSFPGGLPGADTAGSAPQYDINNPASVKAAADQGAATLRGAQAERPWTDPETGPSVVNPRAPDAAAAQRAADAAWAGAVTAGGVPTAGEPGGPPLAPGPVWEPPRAPPVRDDWAGPQAPAAGLLRPVPMPEPRFPPTGLPPAVPMPEPRFPETGLPPPVPMPDLRNRAVPGAPVDERQGMADFPAIRAARIAATPPWRFNPDELEGLVNEFGEDVVMGYPGMRRA